MASTRRRQKLREILRKATSSVECTAGTLRLGHDAAVEYRSSAEGVEPAQLSGFFEPTLERPHPGA
jgi:hypothetical protein